MGQKHFGLQHLQLVLTTFSEGNSAFGTGWIFNTNPHSSFWYWRKKQKQTTTELKICHNSDLKITKCTSGFPLVENGLWENSVESVEIHPKKRRQRWTFARSPQSFQLVEKTGPFYNLYTGLFVENITARKWDGYFARELATLLYTRAGRLGWKREILWKKKPQFYGKESPLMLYFKMNQYRILSQKQETFRCRKRLSIEIERRTTHGRKKYPAPSPP